MPAFTFEKIAPPVRRGTIPATSNPSSPTASGVKNSTTKNSATKNSKKPRGVIVQIIDRFVETRARRTLRGKGA